MPTSSSSTQFSQERVASVQKGGRKTFNKSKYSKPCPRGHLNIPEKVSLHDGCPFMTGSLTWGRWDMVLRKCPLSTGCPLVAVSLEDRFYCSCKTRASERKHTWAAMLAPSWPQFPVLQRFKDPNYHCTCAWHFLIAKEIEIWSRWSWFEHCSESLV